MTLNRRRLQRDAGGGIGKSAEYYESRCRDKEKIVLVWSLLAMNVLSAKGLNLDGIALLEFKKSIQDPSNFTGNWDTSDASPCHWQGVGCLSIPGLGEQRVVTVSLARKGLSGTISAFLGNLTYLNTLNLHTNSLSGPIPPELFNASNMSKLFLSANNLTGIIPPEIALLGSALRVLDLTNNNMTGVSEEILRCVRLRKLLLGGNHISGAIPTGIGNVLQGLQQLHLSSNYFNGSIPPDLGNLTLLQGTLNLSHNHLSGAIPPSLANIANTNNVMLDLSYNNLSGPIPPAQYFQSQGPPAFVGNLQLCGQPTNALCPLSPSPSPSNIVLAPLPGNSILNAPKRILSTAALVGIILVSVFGGVFMASLVLYFCLRKLNCRGKNLGNFSPARSDSSSGLRGCLCSWRDPGNGAVSSDQDEGDLIHVDGTLMFTLEELLRASAYVLGKSGVGIVYKAVLDDGSTVAVRRLGEGGKQRRKEFEAEVRTIGQVRHSHLVSLHSYYWAPDEKLLIYDFLPNGSLETALHGRIGASPSKGPLSWDARIRIARGAAHGLSYIHECSPRKYVHGDIKPSNILLDAFFEARISDFGLQHLLNLAGPEWGKQAEYQRSDPGRSSSVSPAPPLRQESGRRPVSPKAEIPPPFLLGAYQAPETVTMKTPNQKCDVYSYGVVLLELLTGRSPFSQLATTDVDLVSWVRINLQKKRSLSVIFDPYLVEEENDESEMIETLQVALSCISINPETRPRMKQVAEYLDHLHATS